MACPRVVPSRPAEQRQPPKKARWARFVGIKALLADSDPVVVIAVTTEAPCDTNEGVSEQSDTSQLRDVFVVCGKEPGGRTVSVSAPHTDLPRVSRGGCCFCPKRMQKGQKNGVPGPGDPEAQVPPERPPGDGEREKDRRGRIGPRRKGRRRPPSATSVAEPANTRSERNAEALDNRRNMHVAITIFLKNNFRSHSRKRTFLSRDLPALNPTPQHRKQAA